jgi:hypothetical protein
MKAITPAEVLTKHPVSLVDSNIVIQAYNQLIRSHYRVTRKAATFSQAALIGRIRTLGETAHGTIIVGGGYLRQEIQFKEAGWIIQPDSGFYEYWDGSKQITFKEQDAPAFTPRD